MSKELRCDIGCRSILKDGEILCGDHVKVTTTDHSTVVVLADGMTNGVHASILSTLTAQIISTMLAHDLPLKECILTISKTLPFRDEDHAAYSTFTVVRIRDDNMVEIIRCGNLPVLFIRKGVRIPCPMIRSDYDGRIIYRMSAKLEDDDLIVLATDGIVGKDWEVDDITTYMEAFSQIGYTAKTLADMLAEESCFHQDNIPKDDITTCMIHIREKKTANLMFGPPSRKELDDIMMKEFFGTKGTHIVSGGTTSTIAARYLKLPLENLPDTGGDGIPPMAKIYGVDLVTEGVVTLDKVSYYAKESLAENKLYSEWGFRRNGACLICRKLFEDATDINFFIGQAVNAGHQGQGSSIDFNYKMHLVRTLTDLLTKMGKRVTVKYY